MNNLDKLCEDFMNALSKAISSGSDGYGGMTWHRKDKACESLKLLVQAIICEARK